MHKGVRYPRYKYSIRSKAQRKFSGSPFRVCSPSEYSNLHSRALFSYVFPAHHRIAPHGRSKTTSTFYESISYRHVVVAIRLRRTKGGRGGGRHHSAAAEPTAAIIRSVVCRRRRCCRPGGLDGRRNPYNSVASGRRPK